MNISQSFDLFYLAKNKLSLPAYISRLFKGAYDKDPFALNMLIEEFSFCLLTLSNEIHKEYEIPYNGMKDEFLNAGIETIQMFMNRCDEKGFTQFLILALKTNMTNVYTIFYLRDWE